MNQSHSIPHLSVKEQPENFQAKFSKWISLDALIDENEMQDFLLHLNPLLLLTSQNLSEKNPFKLESDHFLQIYKSYISCLKKSEMPEYRDFKKYFYLFLSSNTNDIYIRKIGEKKEALTINSPLVEVKPICLTISSVDQSIRVMPLNPNGILWGFRFSFPQIIQKGGGHDIEQIDFQKHPNGQLFKRLRTWMRENTKPTPFIINEKKVNLPIRLGKKCFSWINYHPQFNELIKVAVS